MMRVTLTRLEQEEHGARAEARASEGRLAEARPALEQRGAALERECAALRVRLELSRRQGDALGPQIDGRREAADALARENAELEGRLQELRQKGGCAVC